jgi:hypothetical protein
MNIQHKHGLPARPRQSAVWEHEVRAEARKGWRWLIYGPVAGIFTAVVVLLLTKG